MFSYTFVVGYQYLRNQVYLSFLNCTFVSNSNMESMIYIEPSSSRVITGSVIVTHCNFCKNRDINFIKVESKREIFWQLTNQMIIRNTKVCSNTHSDNSNNLVSVTNTMIALKNLVYVGNNENYNSLLRLQERTFRIHSKCILSISVLHSRMIATWTMHKITVFKL